MSKLRVAINGFGRIGRLVLRAALESKRDDIEFVAVNDLAPAEQNAYLLQYDSVHGKLPMDVKLDGQYIIVGNQKIKCLAEKDPTKLPWREMNVDGMHRYLYRRRQGTRSPGRWRETRFGVRPIGRRRRHNRIWREPRHIKTNRYDCFKCVLHNELSGPCGARFGRHIWHYIGLDDNCACIHRRPAITG